MVGGAPFVSRGGAVPVWGTPGRPPTRGGKGGEGRAGEGRGAHQGEGRPHARGGQGRPGSSARSLQRVTARSSARGWLGHGGSGRDEAGRDTGKQGRQD